MIGSGFARTVASSVFKVGLLLLGQVLLTMLPIFMEQPAEGDWLSYTLLKAVLRTALLAVFAWLLEIGPNRRALAEDRVRTAALVEASAESVLTLDARGRILSLNSAALLLLSRNQTEFKDHCIHTVAGLEELKWMCGCEGPRAPVHRSGRLTYRSSPTRVAVIDWFTTPLPEGSGSILSMHDVTEAVESLERAQLQAAALNAAASAILITDTHGRIEWVNSWFKKLTGYGDEAIGQSPMLLNSGKYDDAFYQRLWDTVRGGEAWSGEMVNRCKDGSLFTALCTVTPVAAAGGKATHYVLVAQDVTQQRDLERRLAVSERMASLGTLAAGVAHEINNPLSFITSNLGYVRTYIEHGEGNPAEVISALEDANMGAQRVRKIVLALRSFSRVGDGPQRALDVRLSLEQALTIAGSQLRTRAQVSVNLGATPLVRADEGRLTQVFLNLLVNAAQAIEPGKPGANEVKLVSSVTTKGDVLIEITDTGCGLSDVARRHLFEPFFTTKPVGVGTGLGLYICHNLVHGMGGELSVESVEGRGSTFSVLLRSAEQTEVAASHAA